MFDKPQSAHVLGLDLDAFSLKGAALSLVRGKYKVGALFDYLVEPAEDAVKPLYTVEERERLEILSRSHLVVSAAPTQDMLVRPLELRLKKEKDIDAALLFQVEPILPYPSENALVDKVVLEKDKEGTKLTVAAMRKDHLEQHLKQWEALEIIPEVVSAAPHALALFAHHYLAKESPCYVLHLGIANAFCIVIENGKLIAAQAIPGGLNGLIDVIAEETGSDRPTAYNALTKMNFTIGVSSTSMAVNTALEALRMSVMRTVYALVKQLKSKEINEIIATGPGAVIEGLATTLCAPLKKSLVAFPELDGISLQDALLYALPIGQALSAMPKCPEQVNFRQQEFAYPEPWKRLKQPIMQYFALCAGVAIALFIFGKAYIAYQEGEMHRQYLELLEVMNKPYTAFEKEFLAKNPTSRDLNPGEIIEPASLTSDEIKSRLNYIDKEIQATPQLFPLLPNVPRVSDVLAWISAHPAFVKQGEGGDGGKEALQIESFSYVVVKRPEPTKKQEKYQVKVELEFSTLTPKRAREFHDALIAPNDMVDAKGEIKWSSNRDRYRTSFFLKDKTHYPNL